MNRPKTLKELKNSGYKVVTIKEEMERNLVRKMNSNEELFPGIHGFDNTVIPQITNAILAHHDIVFLGEKGQAKTRLMRELVNFLDEEIPVMDGCEINDNPFDPICKFCKDKIKREGEDMKIRWLRRDLRYGERLAPGTKISDLIGDLDPAKVAGGSPLASEDALHFGLIPRMNRGIFAINEFPDLEYLIQVSLFNILEERDVQIRGYPIRFCLDVMLIFTANPEEYSRSGKIISQLKDRIGAEIRTHYPLSRETGIKIIEQEARLNVEDGLKLNVPLFMKDIIEQITIEARKSPYVNHKSGVSTRLSVSNYETMIANSRRRAIILKEKEIVPRISDLNYLFTSSSGKIELDPFREEALSEFQVINRIMEKAISHVFEELFKKKNLDDTVKEIKGDKNVQVSDMMPSKEYKNIISQIPQIWEPVYELGGEKSDEMRASCVEFVLEGLHLMQKLSRKKIGEIIAYKTKAP